MTPAEQERRTMVDEQRRADRPSLADSVAQEAERTGVDLARLVSEGRQAVQLAQDDTVDERRRELAYLLAEACGGLLAELMAAAVQRWQNDARARHG
jgi:hypothetical protein